MGSRTPRLAPAVQRSQQAPLGLVCAIAVALLCVFALVGAWVVVLATSNAYAIAHAGRSAAAQQAAGGAAAPGGTSGSSARSAGTAPTYSSGKLAGAREETDADGVVHGTMPDGTRYLLYGRGETSQSSSGAISLAAVGDVFATTMNLPIVDAYAGATGDGEYDFGPYYRAVRNDVARYDLRFINQETPCAGTDDGREYTGYPVFNTPDSSVHALADAGFNIVNFNSNHTWDMEEYGIERTHGLFAQHPQLMVVGSYASAEDRQAVRLVERNGATIAVLSYSYGDNSFGEDPSAFPNNYYTCQFDKDVMRDETERAKRLADAVVVYMHWGTEYTTEPNEQQLDYAQFLADQDVDLVIGSHAHILQPIRYVTGASGKRVPVVYGLSDFITGWTLTDTILSGMFTCDFVWDNGALRVDNCAFAPAIEWSDGGDTYVRFLKDMTDEEIAANTRTEDVSDDVAYLHDFIDDLGMEVPVNR